MAPGHSRHGVSNTLADQHTMKITTLLLAAAAGLTTETGTGKTATETKGASPEGPQGPTTPEQLRDLTLPQLIEQKPSFETLKAMGLAALSTFASACVEAQTRVKNAADKFRKTAKGVGKILAAMKVTYAEAQDAGTLAKGTSFEDYHKTVTGEKPWNHAMQCARVFLELVLTGRLDEADYDRRAADWLQTASVILGILKENGKDLDCDEVKQLVKILKTAADDEGAKQLRQLRNTLKGKDSGSEDGTVPALDLKNYDAILRRGCSMDFDKVSGLEHASAVVRELVAGEKRPEVLRAIYRNLVKAGDACGTLPQQAVWMKEMEHDEKVARGESPVEISEPVAQAA
jgi:hypothetical protein